MVKIYLFLPKYFLGPRKIVPGPGAYNIPSVFDKNRKYRVPLN